MSLVWLEAALPLRIIRGMLCIMGNSQYYIHKDYHGQMRNQTSHPQKRLCLKMNSLAIRVSKLLRSSPISHLAVSAEKGSRLWFGTGPIDEGVEEDGFLYVT